MAKLGVYSEVGKLRKVLVHRPDLSLKRLTPSNCEELLFDGVLWVKKARWEHDIFVDQPFWQSTTGAEAEYFVGRLSFRERLTWNHHGFLTSAECL